MCGEYEYRVNLAKLWTQAVLFGIYVMLFAGSVYTLVCGRRNSRYLAVTVVLFILTAAYTIGQLVATLLTPNVTAASIDDADTIIPCSIPASPAWKRDSLVGNIVVLVQDYLWTAKFIVADGLLISRCFTLWDSRIRMIALPSALLAGTTACNLASSIYSVKFFILSTTGSAALFDTAEALNDETDLLSNIGGWLSLATNITTTFLIVLRIWLMKRDIEKALGKGAAGRYRSAIAMVVESGALFSASLLADSIVSSFAIDGTICDVMMEQLMAIAPTLLIVRVGMGKGFETVQDSEHNAASLNVTPASYRRDHEAPAVSGIHFRTVQEVGSMGSALESGMSGNVSTVKKDKNAGDTGDVI